MAYGGTGARRTAVSLFLMTLLLVGPAPGLTSSLALDPPWGSAQGAPASGAPAEHPALPFTAAGDVPPASDPSLVWHTFLGGTGCDTGGAIALDASGGIYVTGASDASWGQPLRAHAGDWDAFVARVDGDGTLLWHTFLGGEGEDRGNAIAIGSSGEIYVAGTSGAAWGAPLAAHAGGTDAFVAQLGADGSLAWHTFLGSAGDDGGQALAADGSDQLYVAGASTQTWGQDPERAHAGDGVCDAFAAKLQANGTLIWHTFLGGPGCDEGNAVAVGSNGNAYVAGTSADTWGDPLRAHSGGAWFAGEDAFAARLDGDGGLVWNTFLGAEDCGDYGQGITVDRSGNVYLTGIWCGDWVPENPYEDEEKQNAFAAQLNANGHQTWATVFGAPQLVDASLAIAVAGNGNAHLAGYTGYRRPALLNALVVELDGDGNPIWDTRFGASELAFDQGTGIALDGRGHRYVAGYSATPWGNPVRSWSDCTDAFVAYMGEQCTRDGVYLYEQPAYGGRCLKLTASEPDLARVTFDDTASSIRFVGTYGGGRYVAVLYAQVGYEGFHTVLSEDDPDFADDEIGNGAVSSLRIFELVHQRYLPLVVR